MVELFLTIVTRQRLPTRFWSTSNSVSMRPSSDFAFSFQWLEALHPLGRLGKAEEIARGVAFLVDENGGFITGSTLSVNGGQHMY